MLIRRLIEEPDAEVEPTGFGTLIEERTSHRWGGVPKDEVVVQARRPCGSHSGARSRPKAGCHWRGRRAAGAAAPQAVCAH